MSVTNWTTKPSTVADVGLTIKLFFNVNPDGTPVQEDDDTPIKAGRIAVTGFVRPDANARPYKKTLTYRPSDTSEDHDGDADGSNADNPLPVDTGSASDLTALQTVFSRMKKQWREDSNGDVES